MTTGGKVLIFLNVVLLIAFVLLTAPVAKYRTDMAGKIRAEEAKLAVAAGDGVETVPEKLAATRQRIRDLQKEVPVATTRNIRLRAERNMVAPGTGTAASPEVARLNDLLANEQARQQRYVKFVTGVQEDIEAALKRQTELRDRIAEVTDENNRQQQANADLSTRLTLVKQQLADTMDNVFSTYDRLQQLSRTAAGAPASEAAPAE